MPVGKLTPDGEIIVGSRHGAHKGGLGTLSNWDCPACGTKNEARRPEVGCAHCGAGDPLKSQAGSPTAPKVERSVVDEVPLQSKAPTAGRPLRSVEPSPAHVKVYRLIEYLITNPAAGQETLRRSLVGTMTLPWGQLTATIVDSVDGRQEDLLRMARMQPGVWLVNPEAMNAGVPPPQQLNIQTRREHARGSTFLGADLAQDEDLFAQVAREREKRNGMEPPDTGPQFSEGDTLFARSLYHLAEQAREGSGYPFVHTLALALSNVAAELEGNMEPLKFMESAVCLRLANALMDLIPSDWDPQLPVADDGPGGT